MATIPLPELRAAFRRDPLSLVGRVPGVFPVDKPRGPTSHDVVDIARRQLGMRRVGHGGTLDPMATGLLLILAGNATRLFDELQVFDKSYVADFRLGARTDTHDATGNAIASALPEALPVSREALEAALLPFRGEILQTPPLFSALKRGGKSLHRLAREGKSVAREPRSVTVSRLDLTAFDGRAGRLTMTVSKGFYVRTLVDDLGLALGCGAVMTALERTRIGPFTLAEAVAPEAIAPPVGE